MSRILTSHEMFNYLITEREVWKGDVKEGGGSGQDYKGNLKGQAM